MRWGEMPEVSVEGILSCPQPPSHAQWEIFLAGAALKTLCPGLDFHEKYSTCPCQSLAPSSHSYCQKVLSCSTQLDFNLQNTDNFKLKQGSFRLNIKKTFLWREWWNTGSGSTEGVVVTVPRGIKKICCYGTWFRGGLDSVMFMVGLNDLNGHFQPKWFHDYSWNPL